MNELHSSKDIEKISFDLLQASKSFDIFPTPVDKIIQWSGLTLNEVIDIAVIENEYRSKASTILESAVSKLRGLYDRNDKTIYLDLSQKPSRKNFVKLHETGHGLLFWQGLTFDLFEDDDDSLSDHTNEEFEAEANYFASITLFQHDRFISELSKYDLELDSAVKLSKHFGASIHATLRRYVECSPKRCALLVLEKMAEVGTPMCYKKDFIVSPNFRETFGEIELPEKFGYKWEFSKCYYHKRKGIIKGEINLDTQNGNVDFDFHFFNNSYNGLVFLMPSGEKQSIISKVFITDSV